MNHIDLFSGIGGFALAARWAGFHTVCFVEIDKYAQAVLRKNFTENGGARRNGSEPHGDYFAASDGEGRRPRLFSDIRSFDATAYRGATLLTGGFPCQPFSQAGKRAGTKDDRYLWPEMLRVIREARPAWVVGENVAGLVTMELDNVLSDLEGEGYGTQAFVVPAVAVDARHRRDRVWIVGHDDSRVGGAPRQGDELAGEPRVVGYADGPGLQGHRELRERGSERAAGAASEDVADAEGRSVGAGLCAGGQAAEWGRRLGDGSGAYCEWEPEPGMGRVANGVPRRVDRLKGLGNAVVPQVAYEILRGIAAIEQ